MGIMQMFARLSDIAYGKLSVKHVQPGASLGDPDFVQDFHWHTLLGNRWRFIKERTTERQFLYIIVSCILFEPLWWFTQWWLRRGSFVRRATRQQQGKTPPVCDMIWMHASPAVRMLQYWSSLAAGKGGRLKLLWSRSHSSWGEWCEDDANAEVLAVYRKTLFLLSSWTFVHFISDWMVLPRFLAAFVDPRRCIQELRLLADDLFELAGEQIDDWMGAVILEIVGSQQQTTGGVMTATMNTST